MWFVCGSFVCVLLLPFKVAQRHARVLQMSVGVDTTQSSSHVKLVHHRRSACRRGVSVSQTVSKRSDTVISDRGRVSRGITVSCISLNSFASSSNRVMWHNPLAPSLQPRKRSQAPPGRRPQISEGTHPPPSLNSVAECGKSARGVQRSLVRATGPTTTAFSCSLLCKPLR